MENETCNTTKPAISGKPLLAAVNLLNKPNTVIVCNNKSELAYVIAWCDENNKHVADFMRTNDKFPYCLSIHGSIVGWLTEMDRAVYFIDFISFVKAVS